MKPALFIFADDEMTSCVLVRECDNPTAKAMIGRTLTSPASMPVNDFDPLEFSTVFVAANKSRPYDVLFAGEFDDEADYEESDVGYFYEVRQSKTNPDTLMVVPLDLDAEGADEAWLLRLSYLN